EVGRASVRSGGGRTPPRIEDFSELTIDRDDFNDLRECRPGRCDVRVGTAAARTLATAIDWRAPDAADRLNAWAREQLTAYVASYIAQGDNALIPSHSPS